MKEGTEMQLAAETRGPRMPKSISAATSSHLFDSFLWGLRFPPTAQTYARRVGWRVCIAPVWVRWVGLCGPEVEEHLGPVQGGCSSCPVGCWERLWPPVNMDVSFTLISMFNIEMRSLCWRLMMILWPEICHRNLTLVYINEPSKTGFVLHPFA